MYEKSKPAENPFDDLAVLVGMEFNDCSITAAETYRGVREQFDKVSKSAAFCQIDEDPTQTIPVDVVNLGTVLSGRETGSPAKLVLVWPVAEKVIEQKVGVLRRSVSLTERNRKGNPMLAAKIGEDCIMPLASFAHREGSLDCSYVQLGSEMTDESVVMTGLDDDTPRHQVVEAIRSVIENSGRKAITSNQTATDVAKEQRQTRQTLQVLLDKQLFKYHEKVAEALEAQLVRRCFEKVVNVEETTELNVLAQDDNSTYREVMRVAKLLENVRTEDGRIIDLVIARESTNDDIRLLAVARGDIALPIATMFIDSGTIVFENEQWNERDDYRDNLVSTLLDRVRNINIVPKWQTPEGYSLRSQGISTLMPDWGPAPERPDSWGNNGYNYYDRLAATYCYELGLLRKDEGALDSRYQSCGITREGAESTYRGLERFFSDPQVMELPFALDETSPPIELALSRLPKLQEAQQAILSMFGITSGISGKIGECLPEEERLISKMYRMSQRATHFAAVLKDLNTGKTEADISVRAEISKQGTTYEVHIFAKPEAMEGAEYKSLSNYTFNITQPLFERSNGITSVQISARARQLFDILGRLQPVHSGFATLS